tara:strand:- start:66 stop:902 length:837 start_codon:yes stop_codon:yes gene_type:complete
MTDLEKALASAGIDSDQASALIKGHMNASVTDVDVLDAAGSLIEKAMHKPKKGMHGEDEEDEEKGMGYGSYKGAHDEEKGMMGYAKKGAHEDENGMVVDKAEEEDEALLFDELDDEDDTEKAHCGTERKGAHEDDDDDDDDVEKAYDMVAIISKGADAILDSVENQNNALAKGFFAVRDAHRSLEKSVRSLESKLDSIVETLGQPVAPRSHLSTDGLAVVEPVKKGSGIDVNALLAKAKSRIAETSDMSERGRLAMAVAEIDSGVNPVSVASRYGLAD